MAYKNGTPSGVLYIGHVKWSNDYRHVMLFSNLSARNTFMTTTLNKIKNNVIYYNPNNYIDVDGNIKGIETYNYVFYQNDSDITDSYFPCFIRDYEYIAPNTTRIYIELDVFQKYFYTTTFYQSYIERAIISKSADNLNVNYLPEPVTAPLEYEKKLSDVLTASDWAPYWVLHMASRYNHGTGEYDYSGTGTDNTFGEYGRFIQDISAMQAMLKMYGRKGINEVLEDFNDMLDDVTTNFTTAGKTVLKGIIQGIFSGGIATTAEWNDLKGFDIISGIGTLADFQDHRNELIGLYAIPKWLHDAHISDGGDANYASNKRLSKSVSLSINSSTLANGYTPRNKKMLTSVCRAYILANKTGMKKAFKPELFSSAPTLTLTGIGMSTSGYQWQISNYTDIQDSYDEVSYNSERRVGYDANTGLNKVINTIGAVDSVGASLGGIAGGVATGNPVTAISGAGATASNLIRAIDTVGQREQHFGHNGDLLRITGGRAQLSWYEVSPTVAICQSIDNFFDMYGYTINRHMNPTTHFNSRSVWNYIKTDSNINMSCQAPAVYENIMKSIFANGVTMWHNYTHFGDYSQTNA